MTKVMLERLLHQAESLVVLLSVKTMTPGVHERAFIEARMHELEIKLLMKRMGIEVEL